MKTLWEKEKLLVTSNFSFSQSVFYPFGKLVFHFHQICNCRLRTLSVWKRLKFVVWERVDCAIRSFIYIVCQISLEWIQCSNGCRLTIIKPLPDDKNLAFRAGTEEELSIFMRRHSIKNTFARD